MVYQQVQILFAWYTYNNYIVLAPMQEPSLHGSVTQMKQGQHSRIRRRADPITKNTGSLTSISFIQLSNSHYLLSTLW